MNRCEVEEVEEIKEVKESEERRFGIRAENSPADPNDELLRRRSRIAKFKCNFD